jgi:hypothetical protein
LSFASQAQNILFNPYSRYGLGDLNPPVLAHNSGMGGACIALKPDSTMPMFINTGNPAAYPLIKLTSLEVGANFMYGRYKSNTGIAHNWGTNFSYATLGFPVRRNGAGVLGITPYSSIGYNMQTSSEQDLVGTMTYSYSGNGYLNKAFIGYGLMPFDKRLIKFRANHLYIADSLKTMRHGAYQVLQFGNKLLSDFSLGLHVNYLFGYVNNVAKVIYPNSLIYNNTLKERQLILGDFTGNFGAQTAITIDSVRTGPHKHRALREKVKFTMGFFMGLNNTLKANYTASAYNYILNGSGQEIIRDTAYYLQYNQSTIKLPLEQGFGIGFKKGERINIAADFAITYWQQFRFLNETNTFKNNYRAAIGCNYVPDKYASGRGSYGRRMNYRFGASYQSGYININNQLISDYYVSGGIGIPVGIGRLSSMVNISAQYGRLGTLKGNLLQQNYWRINFGFTFSDRWFQKFRYD